MKVTIHNERIDITELPLGNRIRWNPLLDELRSEHIPMLYQNGKRMGMNIVNGRLHAYIYRTDKTPTDSEILEILNRHGIAQICVRIRASETASVVPLAPELFFPSGPEPCNCKLRQNANRAVLRMDRRNV